MKSPCAVNLHKAVTVSQQRLGKRVVCSDGYDVRASQVNLAFRYWAFADGSPTQVRFWLSGDVHMSLT